MSTENRLPQLPPFFRNTSPLRLRRGVRGDASEASQRLTNRRTILPMHPNSPVAMMVGTAHQDPLMSSYFVQRQRARRLRKGMTDAELKLWRHIRGRQLRYIQFYRQRPLGPFIADFWAPAIDLVIEVDGGQHFSAQGRRADARRDAWFRRRGLRVVRYDNVQVLTEIEAVLRHLLAVMDERLVDSLRSHPLLPPF